MNVGTDPNCRKKRLIFKNNAFTLSKYFELNGILLQDYADIQE